MRRPWQPQRDEFHWRMHFSGCEKKWIVICVKWKWYAFAFPGIGLNVELLIMFRTSCNWEGAECLHHIAVVLYLSHYFYRSSISPLFNDLLLLSSNLLLIFASSLFHRRFSIFHPPVLFESFRPNCKNEKNIYKLSSCIQNSECNGIARHPIVYPMHVFVFDFHRHWTANAAGEVGTKQSSVEQLE